MNWIKLLIGGVAMFTAYCMVMAWIECAQGSEPFIDILMRIMAVMAKVVALGALFLAGLYLTFTAFV